MALLLAGAGCSGRTSQGLPLSPIPRESEKDTPMEKTTHKLIPSIGGEGRTGEEVQCM